MSCLNHLFSVFAVGFEDYCELYASYPIVLLCIRYICDVGHCITGAAAADAAAATHETNASIVSQLLSLTA